MTRTIAVAVFGQALASVAQALPFAPIHQPNAVFTQVREGCGRGEG